MKPCLFILSILFLLESCSQPGIGRYAIVELRDGTSLSGTVLAISATEIRIAEDANVTLTNSMADVLSIDYDVAPPAAVPPKTPLAPGQFLALPREPQHGVRYHPAEAAITTKAAELSQGTSILVRNEETIDSDKAVEGQAFPAEITRDVLDAAGDVVIPRGSNAEIVIRSIAHGEKIRGAPDLVLDLPAVSVEGRQYRLAAAEPPGKGQHVAAGTPRSGDLIGGRTMGAIIGAIIDSRNAAFGGGSGATAAQFARIFIKDTIRVPVESVLIFQLNQPVRVSAAN